MTTYSNSRVSTYDNCPYQYKLRYIDKKKPEISTTIEAFMGDMVHQSLEDLYKRKKFQQRIAKASLIKFFRNLWAKNYSSDILIVKEDQGLTENNYRKMGEKFLLDYFERMKPFEELTILGLETQDRMTLPDGNQWHVRIDKLGCDNDGNYFVCDYKTNARMKDQEEADQDRQLAMYSIWVKDKFKDAKSVKLVWHMLAFNKDAISERTDEQLEKLQNEIVEKIKEIENAKEFPTNVTALCNYCGFKSECPSFKHQAELEKIESVEEFKEDEGVKLVDEFAETKKNLSELNKKEDEPFPIVLTISMLYHFFSKVLVYHFIKNKTNKQEVAAALKINPYFIADYEKAAKQYNPRKVVEIIALLREYDLRAKGLNSENTPDGELLKELVYKILH